MRFSPLPFPALLLTLTLAGVKADDKKSKSEVDPCTITSSSGTFYDLRSLSVVPADEGKKSSKTQKTASWHAKGYDYPANFTLNVCAPVIERLDNVKGVDEEMWADIGAYYEIGSRQYSLG